jgi:hypothetical protein
MMLAYLVVGVISFLIHRNLLLSKEGTYSVHSCKVW